MVWALTLLVCALVYGPRLILYMTPGWIVLVFVGLMWAWPHMTAEMRSFVSAAIGGTAGLFLGGLVIAIPLRLFLGIPVREGTIGCVLLVVCYYVVTTIGNVWHAATHTVTVAVGAISPVHWGAAGVGITGLIVIGSWRTWRGRVPRPRADEDDDDFDDYFDHHRTDTRPVLRPAPPRLSRAERRAAAIYAGIERKAKVSAAWEAWYSGRGPAPF
jgi:hypothetical protein